MPTNKFAKVILIMVISFAIPFFMMVYSLKCKKAEIAAQKQLIEKLVERQRLTKQYANQICHGFDNEAEESD